MSVSHLLLGIHFVLMFFPFICGRVEIAAGLTTSWNRAHFSAL